MPHPLSDAELDGPALDLAAKAIAAQLEPVEAPPTELVAILAEIRTMYLKAYERRQYDDSAEIATAYCTLVEAIASRVARS